MASLYSVESICVRWGGFVARGKASVLDELQSSCLDEYCCSLCMYEALVRLGKRRLGRPQMLVPATHATLDHTIRELGLTCSLVDRVVRSMLNVDSTQVSQAYPPALPPPPLHPPTACTFRHSSPKATEGHCPAGEGSLPHHAAEDGAEVWVLLMVLMTILRGLLPPSRLSRSLGLPPFAPLARSVPPPSPRGGWVHGSSFHH